MMLVSFSLPFTDKWSCCSIASKLRLCPTCAGQECLGSPRWGPMLPMFLFRGLSRVGCGVLPGTGSMSLKPTVNNENCTPRERIHIPPWGLAENHRLRSAGDWMGYVS